MKNVCIDPYDEVVQVMATAISVLNEFKKKGFTSRKAFIEIVQEKCPELNNYDGLNKLGLFWIGRIKEDDFNAKLDAVLESLKAE